MQAWHIAMLLLVPLMMGSDKARVWMVMLAASIASYVAWGPAWFLAIDIVAAALVLAKPRGDPQRAIGALFAAMAIFDIGYLLSPQQGSEQYVATLGALGWLQWLVLLFWGVADAWRYYSSRFRALRRLPDIVTGRVG